MSRWIHLSSALIVLAAISTLSGCAAPGAPQPPSLRIPKRVDNLTATRKGNKVTLTWTVPHLTTDNDNIRRAGTTLVCRGINDFPMIRCEQQLSADTDAQAVRWKKAEQVPRKQYTDELPAGATQQSPLGFVTYAVEDNNANGRSAGLSNQVQVPLAPTLAPPAKIEAQVIEQGVELKWPGTVPAITNAALEYSYRILRKDLTDPKQPEVIAGEVPIAGGSDYEFLDRNFEWEKKFAYHIAAITHVNQAGKETIEVEGDDSPVVEVLVHDVFPPTVPTGLQAVYSGVGQKPFIDLTWAPDLESDLAGYNVYRHEEGQPAVKINESLVKTPAYRDASVARGHRYSYSVSAVDVHGNESGRSEEASERVPQE